MCSTDFPSSLEAISHQSLTANGFSESDAASITKIIVLAVINHFGSQQVYVPKRGHRLYRDREIYQRANGSNTAELVQEYELSPAQIKKIIAKGRQTKGRQ